MLSMSMSPRHAREMVSHALGLGPYWLFNCWPCPWFLITLAMGWMPSVRNKTCSWEPFARSNQLALTQHVVKWISILSHFIPPVCKTLFLPVYTMPKPTYPSPRGLWEGRKLLGQGFSEAGRAGSYRETTSSCCLLGETRGWTETWGQKSPWCPKMASGT